eukprot:SAG31_NODE_735_length_12488_cov_7.086044_7_plen_34_part_00
MVSQEKIYDSVPSWGNLLLHANHAYTITAVDAA